MQGKFCPIKTVNKIFKYVNFLQIWNDILLVYFVEMINSSLKL